MKKIIVFLVAVLAFTSMSYANGVKDIIKYSFNSNTKKFTVSGIVPLQYKDKASNYDPFNFVIDISINATITESYDDSGAGTHAQAVFKLIPYEGHPNTYIFSRVINWSHYSPGDQSGLTADNGDSTARFSVSIKK